MRVETELKELLTPVLHVPIIQKRKNPTKNSKK